MFDFQVKKIVITTIFTTQHHCINYGNKYVPSMMSEVDPMQYSMTSC